MSSEALRRVVPAGADGKLCVSHGEFLLSLLHPAVVGAGGVPCCQARHGTYCSLKLKYGERNGAGTFGEHRCPWYLICEEAERASGACYGCPGNKMYLQDGRKEHAVFVGLMPHAGAPTPP